MTLSITALYNYAGCRASFIVLLNVIMLNVIMLNVIMLNVAMLCHYAEFCNAVCRYAECCGAQYPYL
jgi:hypothetical protein